MSESILFDTVFLIATTDNVVHKIKSIKNIKIKVGFKFLLNLNNVLKPNFFKQRLKNS